MIVSAFKSYSAKLCAYAILSILVGKKHDERVGKVIKPGSKDFLLIAGLERRSSKCAVAPLMSQSRERDTTGTNVVKAQPNLSPKGFGGQQQG